MNAIASLIMSNRHPVDQTADVRETIKHCRPASRTRKGRIGKLMGKADSLGGDEWIARRSYRKRKGSIDGAAQPGSADAQTAFNRARICTGSA